MRHAHHPMGGLHRRAQVVKKKYENGAVCPTPSCDGIYTGKTGGGLCNRCYVRAKQGKTEGLVGNRRVALAGRGHGRWTEPLPQCIVLNCLNPRKHSSGSSPTDLCVEHWKNRKSLPMPECSFPGCTQPSRTRQKGSVLYCSGHYQQYKNKKELRPLIVKRWPVIDGMKQCSNCLQWSSLHVFGIRNSTGKHQSICPDCKPILARVSKYGGTYNQMKELVGRGRCDICDRECVVQIDHCHSTNRIRGALCTRCNLSLGQLEDSPSLLRSMLGYLLRHAVSFGGAA